MSKNLVVQTNLYTSFCNIRAESCTKYCVNWSDDIVRKYPDTNLHKERHCQLHWEFITYMHVLYWLDSARIHHTLACIGPIRKYTIHDVVRTIHWCATNILLCDLLLARFQALSMKPRELPKTTSFYAVCREIGSLCRWLVL